jgi:uncharacterized protein YkwD
MLLCRTNHRSHYRGRANALALLSGLGLGLALAACGDGTARPILQSTAGDEPSGGLIHDAGTTGAAGSDAGAENADADGPGDPQGFCAEVQAWPEAQAALEAQIYNTINGLRAVGLSCSDGELGPSLPLLGRAIELDCAARRHTKDMIERGFFDHVNPEGEGPAERIERAGFVFGVHAEIIGDWDLQGGLQVRDSLFANVDDCEKLVDPRFDAVGVGQHDGVLTIVLAGPVELSP